MGGAIETTDLSAIRLAWEHVFLTNDPFTWPFRQEFPVGHVFYPTDGYHLTKPQFGAIREALKQVGETGFFLSIVESEGLSFLDRRWGHWVCENLSYEDYIQLPLSLENCICSRRGDWGILVSHEMHALVAGSQEFLTAIAEQYQGWPNDLRQLREAWSGNPNASWLEPTISHTP